MIRNYYNQSFDEFIVFFQSYNDFVAFGNIIESLTGNYYYPLFFDINSSLPVFGCFPIDREFMKTVTVFDPNLLNNHLSSGNKVIYDYIFSMENPPELESFLWSVLVYKIPVARLMYSPKKLMVE